MKRLAFAVILAAVAASSPAFAGDTEFDFYGYLKADVIYDFKQMGTAWNSTMRPSQIPVLEDEFPHQNDGELIFNVKASRVGVNILHPTEGQAVHGKLELDFYGTDDNAGKFLPRVRHAHIVYGKVLIGQAWSLFNDPDVWPMQIDFWGPNGILASRRPQVRYTFTNDEERFFALGFEQPGAGLDAGKAPAIDPEFDVEFRSYLPDFTVRYRLKRDWGYVQAAGVARSLAYEGSTIDGDFDGEEFGWGGYLTGRVATGERNELMLSFMYGEGAANYSNDGGRDLAGDDAGNAVALPLTTWHASYNAWWNEKLSTSLGFSQVIQDNSGGQEDDAFKTGSYAFINLLRHPAPGLLYGFEFLWGELEQKGGESNDDVRVQFSTKFSF